MRRAVLAALTTATIVLGAANGCDCGKKSAKPAAGSSTPTRDRPDTARKTPPRTPRDPRDLGDLPKADVRRTAPITLDEAKAAMPTLDGARPLGMPAVAPSGAQARTSYCLDADDILAAGESVVGQLTAAGWQRVTGRPPVAGAEPPQYGIAGERGALRISATVMAVSRTGCDATVNQYFTVLAIQKIASDAAAGAGDAAPEK